MSVSIIYYTSNTEDPAFEEKIRERLVRAANGIPIISVSQKPIDLGTNICVGEVGPAYANEYRQILIGAQAAKTEWVLSAEADVLYPPAYFSFMPTEGDLWRYDNVWILWRSAAYGGRFKRKHNSEGAQITRRDWLIERLTMVMDGLPEWHDPAHDWDKRVYWRADVQRFFGSPDEPVVSVKSGNGMRPNTQVSRAEAPADALPFWGDANQLRKELFG